MNSAIFPANFFYLIFNASTDYKPFFQTIISKKG